MWSEVVLISILCIFTVAVIVVVAGLCWFWRKRKCKQRKSKLIRYNPSSPTRSLTRHNGRSDDHGQDKDDSSQRIINGTFVNQNGVHGVTELDHLVHKTQGPMIEDPLAQNRDTNTHGMPPFDQYDSTDLNGAVIFQTEASVYQQQNQTTGENLEINRNPMLSAAVVDASTHTSNAADTPDEPRLSMDKFAMPDPPAELESVTGINRPIENTSISLPAKR